MKVDDFISYLDVNDVEYTTNDQSIILTEAPCCGGYRKIYLFKEEHQDKPLFGKCMKCDTGWNSASYLRELGHDNAAIDVLHGTADLGAVELAVGTAIGFDLMRADRPEAEEEVLKNYEISDFYKVPELPDHEASVYAKTRGWVARFADDILIDIFASAVVFICREGDRVVGYQRRFLNPPRPDMKAKSVAGFKKTQHIIEYPNDGDIVICEGPFTALSAWHYGYHGICTFGAGVTERQIELVAALAKRTGKAVGVAFDLDKAGRKGLRIIRTGMHWHGIPTFRVRPAAAEGMINGKLKPLNDLNDAWLAGAGITVITADKDDITIPELDIPEDGI